MNLLALALATLLIGPGDIASRDIPNDGSGNGGDGPGIVRVGHFLEVRGTFDREGLFVAERVELLPPEDDVIIGTVREKPSARERFVLNGQEIHASARTEWKGVHPSALVGERIKVEGRWRGLRKFSAREVSSRGEGRDRLAARVDAIDPTDDGVVVRMMSFEVFLPASIEIEHDEPLAEIELAPAQPVSPQAVTDDEEDLFGRGIFITDKWGDLRLLGQAELKATTEDGYDLDDAKREDRAEYESSLRTRLEWTPSDRFSATASVRGRWRHRAFEEPGRSTSDLDASLGETFGWWRDPFGASVDVIFGRQDFDDQREWLYDQNLDALRLIIDRPDWKLDLSASTTLSEGSERDKGSTNLIAYLSNNQKRRHLAAYVVHRDIDATVDEKPTHFGVRATGEWFADTDSWLDVSGLTGERGTSDVRAHAFDVGTTWTPDSLDPLSFTVGYAMGSGDATPGSTDGGFQQTGFADNNGKFDGVTSFRYYGELVDPELANLHVLTAGIGTRIAEKTSLDLVFHHFRQDEEVASFVKTDLDRKPSGLDDDIGVEVDLILGSRYWNNLHLEIVAGWFHPGDAFPIQDDDAYLGKIQLRYRF